KLSSSSQSYESMLLANLTKASPPAGASDSNNEIIFENSFLLSPNIGANIVMMAFGYDILIAIGLCWIAIFRCATMARSIPAVLFTIATLFIDYVLACILIGAIVSIPTLDYSGDSSGEASKSLVFCNGSNALCFVWHWG